MGLDDDFRIKLVGRLRDQRISAGPPGRIVGQASGDAGGLNSSESFCAAFGVKVFVHNLLRGLRETQATAGTEENNPKSQQTLLNRRDFQETSVARCAA